MFNLTAVIGAYRVEESLVISEHRKIGNKCEEELDGVEIQLLQSHPSCKEAGRVTVALHSISSSDADNKTVEIVDVIH
jgi:hypothetical protein